jgi:hypothetical protein
VLLAPLYAAGEAPIAGIDSQALAAAIRDLDGQLTVEVCDSLDALAEQLNCSSQPGDLVLAMGAGDVNYLWPRLQALLTANSPITNNSPTANNSPITNNSPIANNSPAKYNSGDYKSSAVNGSGTGDEFSTAHGNNPDHGSSQSNENSCGEAAAA